MSDRKYQDLLRGLLDFDLKVLYPWKTDTDKKKLSNLFRFFHFSHLSTMLVLLSFIYYKIHTLTFTTIVENVATALTFLRSTVYVWLVVKLHSNYKAQIDKMFQDRTNLPTDQNERRLTEAFCRREYICVFTFHCFIATTGFFLVHLFAYFFPNEYQLMFNCHIIFLPPDGFLLAWELNWLFMFVTTCFMTLFFMCYVPMPLILMNHTCLLLDMALVTAEQMNVDLKLDDDINDPERIERTNELLKKFLERCEKIVDCRNEVQDLLHWNFDLEFQIQAIILCFSIYFLSLDFFASYNVVNIFFVCLTQLFVYCWMGTRVTSRFDQLSYEISKNWYLMPPNQRKVLQMTLHWTQNMEGFTGAFKDVSLETFQSILEASYSFYAFLRSSN